MSKEDMVYDHTKAYEDDGPMGECIKALMDLAEKNGCPILLVAATAADEEMTTLAITQNLRNSMMPDNMVLARRMLALPNVHVQVLEHIVECMVAADANLEHIRSDLDNAAKRVLSEVAEEHAD